MASNGRGILSRLLDPAPIKQIKQWDREIDWDEQQKYSSAGVPPQYRRNDAETDIETYDHGDRYPDQEMALLDYELKQQLAKDPEMLAKYRNEERVRKTRLAKMRRKKRY